MVMNGSRGVRIGLAGCAVAIFALAAVFFVLLRTRSARAPELSAAIQRAGLRSGGRERSFLYYAPARLPAGRPLVFVLHGSRQDGEAMRRATAYEFDRLADRDGFVVVYPDGFGRNWNDCRKLLPVPAREQGIDDEDFIVALIERFRAANGIDPARVFAAGYSNGGHMAYRLALELPDRVAAVAAIAANLPTDDNSVCQALNLPIPVMIVDGTADPINPYAGGPVTLFGFSSRGTVRSAEETAAYFARLDGDVAPPSRVRLPHRDPRDPTAVERTAWSAPGQPEVVLYTIEGGGHVVPQTGFRFPRLLGRTTRDLDAPAEIWSFFARQRPLAAPAVAR
jgi:polyhydroxybutyrate depolymerase